MSWSEKSDKGFLRRMRGPAALFISAWGLLFLHRTRVKGVLTYREAIGYFSANWPKDNSAAKAALVRKAEQHSNALTVSWVFLDEQNTVCLSKSGSPYGRKVEVSGIDRELAALFGENDLVVLA